MLTMWRAVEKPSRPPSRSRYGGQPSPVLAYPTVARTHTKQAKVGRWEANFQPPVVHRQVLWWGRFSFRRLRKERGCPDKKQARCHWFAREIRPKPTIFKGVKVGVGSGDACVGSDVPNDPPADPPSFRRSLPTVEQIPNSSLESLPQLER